ncbi:MAG: FG-GAP-like repeat-containing protein [bacterium]|nr:FG-GAP-like repeat-containing protein [bacterium]
MNRIAVTIATISLIVLHCTAYAEDGFIEHMITHQFDGGFSIIAADVDNDGDNDVVAAAINEDLIAWWENKPDHSFQQHVIDSTTQSPHTVCAVDLDLDGDKDILGCAFMGNEVAWWENDGNQRFIKRTIQASYDGARDVIACDLDQDGDWDVVGCCEYGHDLTWWENDGNQVFTEHSIASFLPFPMSVYACDLDGDQDVDIVLGDHDNGLTWWENLGNQQFTYHTICSAFQGTWDVCAGDIDGDGDIDVAAAGMYEDDLSWWENDGNQTFTWHIFYGLLNGPGRSICLADLDGDNDLDVLGGFEYELYIPWHENDGSDWFVEHLIPNSIHDAQSVYAADMDGDGKMDVLATAYEHEGVAWWENVLGLSVAISPTVPNPRIPAEGDTIDFSMTVRNLSDSLTTFHVWCDVVFPEGTVHGPLLVPAPFRLESDSIKTWLRSQIVPARAPAGIYQYRCFVGVDSSEIWDRSDFFFTKLGGGTGNGDLTGWSAWGDPSGRNELAVSAPAAFNLLQISPNPFNPTTTLTFTLPRPAKVSLEVFDINGRIVRAQHAAPLPAGEQSLPFDGSDLPSGIYFARLSAGEYTAVQKLVLLK